MNPDALRSRVKSAFPGVSERVARRLLWKRRSEIQIKQLTDDLDRAVLRGYRFQSFADISPAELMGSLEMFEAKIRSQNGEDGVIGVLVRELDIRPHRFVEIGVEYGRECNTRALAEFLNWTGTMIDGDSGKVEAGRVEMRDAGLAERIEFVQSFVTTANVADLVRSESDGDLGLLSIDVDGNDYWLWNEVDVRPPLVVMEYNASCGPSRRCTIVYDETFVAESSGLASLYHGASLAALAALGRMKGYSLVYCESTGVNAFFVRDDVLPSGWITPDPTTLWRPHANRTVTWSQTEQEAYCASRSFRTP